MAFVWDDLRYFLAVARAGQLTEASRRLRTDHTTVGRRIVALEKLLDTRLFKRSPRGYTLTEAGKQLVSRAQDIENAAELIVHEISGGNQALSTPVRLCAPEGFGSAFLAPRLPQLIAKHPEIHIELVAMPQVFSLSKREADLTVSFYRPKEQRVVFRLLTKYYIAFMPRASISRRTRKLRRSRICAITRISAPRLRSRHRRNSIELANCFPSRNSQVQITRLKRL